MYRNIYDYLAKNMSDHVDDFTIKASDVSTTAQPDALHVMIHATNHNSETEDFILLPNGYVHPEEMTFGGALEELKAGRKVARKGWNGKGIFLELQVPDEHSKMTQPYIFIDTLGLQMDNPAATKGRVPWLASQTDMLGNDWIVVG